MTGVSAIMANGRSRKIWIGQRLARQPGSHRRDSIRSHVLLHGRSSSETLMPGSTVPNVLRISSAKAVRDDADVIAEAIPLTMYHRNLTLYENLDAI